MVVALAESVNISEDAMIVEVKKGTVEGDVHHRLFAEGISANRFLSGTDVGAGEEVHDVAWLAALHGPV